MAYAIAYFTENLYTVSIPLTDSQDYDIIVDKDGCLKRVQVKTTNSKSKYGVYAASLRVCGGNRSGRTKDKLFDKTKCDQVFVLCGDGNMFSIPASDITGKTYVYLGKDKASYKVTLMARISD